VAQFRAVLAAFSNEHQVPATLRLLEVVVSFRANTARDAVESVLEALERIVARHFPESSTTRQPNTKGGKEAGEDPTAALAEECATLAAIYGPEFEALDETDWRLSLGGGLALRIHLPPGYPREKPPGLRIEGACGGQGPALMQELLAQWAPGDACVYEWMERLREALGGFASAPEEEKAEAAGAEKEAGGAGKTGGSPRREQGSTAPCSEAGGEFTFQSNFRPPGRGPKSVKQGQRQRHFGIESGDPAHAVDLVHGAPLVDRKSTFQAHLACVCCMEQVNWAHRQLLTEKKIASATHNSIAYRFCDSATGTLVSDHDDDNESGAGSILESLLKWCGDRGVFIMVTRWYGGTELGPERFRHIKRVAQRLLGEQGIIKEVTTHKKGPATRKS